MKVTPMPDAERQIVLGKLGGLRAELVEMAFVLDRRGRPEAADVAMTLSAQLEELCDELGEGDAASGELTPAGKSAAGTGSARG